MLNSLVQKDNMWPTVNKEKGSGIKQFQSLFGRSGEAQTRGLRIPNAARYQLRYTPIVIKFWSCKWSNLWSNTFLTVIFCFPYRPKIARLKGFRRLAPINVRNAAYAPKCGALSTALHPDIFDFLLCQPCDFRYNNPLHFPQKHSRTARLERVALLVVFSPQSFAWIVRRTRRTSSPNCATPRYIWFFTLSILWISI